MLRILLEEVSMHLCPLCHSENSQAYFADKQRDYFQCQQCELVYVNPEQRLSAEREKASMTCIRTFRVMRAIDAFYHVSVLLCLIECLPNHKG